MATTPKFKVGIVGCGKISTAYLESFTKTLSHLVEVVGVCDLKDELAQKAADDFGVPKVDSTQALLDDPAVELALNLSAAPAHYTVSRMILDAGKHLYSEKPLALTLEHGRELHGLAEEKGLRLAVAPDTILGGGVQTCIEAVGRLGEVVAGQAFASVSSKSERYHEVFRGALLDMAPYFVGALVAMLGPVKAVMGAASEGKFLAEGHKGRTIEAPSRSAGVLEFESGTLVTLIATSENATYGPYLKLHGTEAALTCNDPNMFDGTIVLKKGYDADETLPLDRPYATKMRGLGVAEMGVAIREDRPHRLSADMALHWLEVMLGIIESAKTGRRVEIVQTCQAPEPMPTTPL
jgi:predicted dehydrogenase